MSLMRGSWLVPLLLALQLCLVSDVQSEPASGDSHTVGSVAGRVTQDGRPAAFANVIVIGTRVGTFAREDGSFQLDRVPVGSRVIQFMAVYCTKSSVPVEVRPGITHTVSVDLECPLMRCFKQERPTADCFRLNEEERGRVGSRCSVHRSVVLASDTVRIGYGLQIGRPKFIAAQLDSFPNARDWWDGGCVIEEVAFTGVAYCGECRRAYERWLRRTGGRE